MDEFYLAAQGDPRRSDLLKDQILDQVRDLGLDKDLEIKDTASDEDQLNALDGYLCELKELQIRDGLHILGKAPEGEQRRDLLLALLRLESGNRPSFLKALAADLGLDFDPLTADLSAPWNGPQPTPLVLLKTPWRTVGDTIERLEIYGRNLLEDTDDFTAPGPQSLAIQTQHAPALAGKLESAFDEIVHLMGGLKGRFVPPSPSGAPTRGRRMCCPRAVLLFCGSAQFADPCGLAIGMGIGQFVAGYSSSGSWRLPQGPGCQRLGHGQYAHRRG